MKRFIRWAVRLFLLLLVIGVLALLLKDTVARQLTERRIQARTGLKVRIGKMSVGVTTPTLTLENVVVYNNADFGGAALISLPELHIEYDRAALLKRRIECKLVRVNLAQANVVEDKNGRLNLESIQKGLDQAGGPLLTTNAASVTSSNYQFVKIDTLILTLGKAKFTSEKNPGMTDILLMGLRNQVLKDVKSGADLQGVLTVIWLKNGHNIVSATPNDPNDPNDRWQYWIDRLKTLEKK